MLTQLSGILLLTFRELWAKKVIVGLFVISTLVWVFFTFALSLDAVEGSLAGIRIYEQTAPEPPPGAEGADEEMAGQGFLMERFVLQVEQFIAGAAYWMGTLLALFAAAPLFTGLLERGHVDLLLSKPISRAGLLAGHVAGVLLMMLLLALYLIGAVWLVMSLKTGVWNVQFLWAVPLLVAMFGVVYAVVVAMGIWTESTALALIVTYGLIFVSIILAFHEQIAPQLAPAGRAVFLAFYHVLPNFAEVSGTVAQLAERGPVGSWYPLVSSLLFGAALYGGAAFWFSRRDF